MMSSVSFECIQCWHEERIGEVINREALSVDRAIFMATHAPFRHIKYLKSPHQVSDTSETALLNELLTCASNHRHAFVVVQGIPGTGKSHLIRWLKERYQAEMGGHKEQVLLIERAQNSLTGTLRQIINSGVFDDEQMHDHRAKLKGATDTLSQKALADNILDHLRVATYEVPLDEAERPKKFISNRIEPFLLDSMVREELKRSGGPIDRLVRFLATGRTSQTGGDELPGFEATDFEFKPETLRKIRGEGYREAKELAENLNQREEFRNDLARYLNRLLNYAIGRTTALSAEDLKQLFGDLRRILRQKGYHLALFIEDITAFTGIDSALVDVLATQHTGESNREFCRLISVIGITDDYFASRFPDNIKERIGYHLSLNADSSGRGQRGESDLLRDKETTADLVARYLNAMRVTSAELEMWENQGLRPEDFPNPCPACPHQPRCHAAFGSIILTEAGVPERMQAGLYPFNAQAIWTMYQGIDTTMTSHTPRSLINSVLLYVMQSHAHMIPARSFPPSAKEMGGEFHTPRLRKPLQRTTIETQDKNEARRIESLVLFWGDGTVDATESESERLLGRVPETVFQAFGVPFIAGEKGEPPPTTVRTVSHPPEVAAEQKPLPGHQHIAEPRPPEPGLYRPAPPKPAQPGPMPVVQTSKYTDDISAWRDGEKLKSYEDLRRFLYNYLSSAIDWEAYNISLAHTDSRFTGRQIEIEGQVGRVQGDCLRFPRSPEFALVLQALADLNDSSLQLDQKTIGGHLANLGTWLYREEERIVAFVQQPHSTVTDHPSFSEILFFDCLMVDWLCGNLRISSRTPRDLLLTIIRSAKATNFSQQQQSLVEQAEKMHAPKWKGVLKGLKKDDIQECCNNLLQTLNCPQGDSKEVHFIDAATALDTLLRFKQQNWTLTPIEFDAESKDKLWSAALDVYAAFQSHLEDIVQEECQHVQEQIQLLDQYMGESKPAEGLQSIQDLLSAFHEHQRNHRFIAEAPSNAAKLEKHRQYLQSLLEDTPREETMLRLSGLAEPMKTIQDFIAYFQGFMKEFQDHQKRLAERLVVLQQADAELEPLRQKVQQTYDQIVEDVREIGEIGLVEDEADQEEAA